MSNNTENCILPETSIHNWLLTNLLQVQLRNVSEHLQLMNSFVFILISLDSNTILKLISK